MRCVPRRGLKMGDTCDMSFPIDCTGVLFWCVCICVIAVFAYTLFGVSPYPIEIEVSQVSLGYFP